MKNAITLLLIITLAAPAVAQGLIDNLEKGTGKVGDVAKKGVDAVGNASDSTSELIKDEETPEATRTKLDSTADEVMDRLIAKSSEANRAVEVSAGHAVLICGGFRFSRSLPDTGAA